MALETFAMRLLDRDQNIVYNIEWANATKFKASVNNISLLLSHDATLALLGLWFSINYVRVSRVTRACWLVVSVELNVEAREKGGDLYCLRCHDKMGIPICGACRSVMDSMIRVNRLTDYD